MVGFGATPNVMPDSTVFGALDALKLNPPAIGAGFAASVTTGAAVEAVEAVDAVVTGVAGLPNENAGSGADVGSVISGFLDASLKPASDLAAVKGDGVVMVAANENPPSRGVDSLAVAGLTVDDVVAEAVVAFSANEMVGFVGKPNDGTDTLFGSVVTLAAVDVAIVAGGVDLIASVDSAAAAAVLVSFLFLWVSGTVTVVGDGKLSTDVVVAVLNVTVVFSPELSVAPLELTTTSDSCGVALSVLTLLSTSSWASSSRNTLSKSANLFDVPFLFTLKTVEVFVFGFTNEMGLSS